MHIWGSIVLLLLLLVYQKFFLIKNVLKEKIPRNTLVKFLNSTTSNNLQSNPRRFNSPNVKGKTNNLSEYTGQSQGGKEFLK